MSYFKTVRKSIKKGKAIISAEVLSPITPITPLKEKDCSKASKIFRTLIRGVTKSSANNASVAKGTTSFKKKKKTKDTPKPPIRIDAKPYISLVYNSGIY